MRPVDQSIGTRVPATAIATANPTLVDAIRTRRRVAFDYNGRTRVVEPQCLGVGTRGTVLLRAHVVADRGVLPAALFDVAKIARLTALDETFDGPGPGYRRDDSAMVTIFAQL